MTQYHQAHTHTRADGLAYIKIGVLNVCNIIKEKDIYNARLVALDIGQLPSDLCVHAAFGQASLGAFAQIRIGSSNLLTRCSGLTNARRGAQCRIGATRQTFVSHAHFGIGAVPRDVVGSGERTKPTQLSRFSGPHDVSDAEHLQ